MNRRTKWQYQTVTVDVAKFWGPKVEVLEFDRMLNNLGESHWELVSTFDTTSGGGTTKEVVMIFRRPVEVFQQEQS